MFSIVAVDRHRSLPPSTFGQCQSGLRIEGRKFVALSRWIETGTVHLMQKQRREFLEFSSNVPDFQCPIQCSDRSRREKEPGIVLPPLSQLSSLTKFR